MSARPAHRLLAFRLLVAVLTLAVTLPGAVVAASLSPTGSLDSTQAAQRDLYIVVQTAPPLSLYQGGIPGLAATNPEALGETMLNPDSAASVAYLSYLRDERTALLNAITLRLGRQVTPVNTYNVALNGFSANLTAAEAAAIEALPGVAFTHRNETLHTLTDAGPQWMNADDVWDGSAVGGAGSKGERVVAGIIDTGVNPGHPSFAGVGPVDGYAHQNPRGRFYGECAATPPPAPGALCNNKLIGLYDFTGVGVADDVGHGSHTASTVAGNVVDATLHAPTTTLSPARISGVAPHANVISYKACFAGALNPGGLLNLGSCPLNALIAAIDQATLDVVDVINFSIGGGSSDPWSGPLQQAFFGTQAAGVFVAASAGNSGPNSKTIGQPANAPWLMAVGASTHDRRPTGHVVATEANGASIQFTGMSVTSSLGPLALIDARDLGNNLCETFNPTQAAQIAGKIVICHQGVIGRVQKGINVQAATGAGMVLIGQAGTGNSVVADTHVIPTVMIGDNDGAALRDWLAGAVSPQATLQGVQIETDSDLADRMAGFSSRGPDANSSDVIKPDVTAPGVAILAAWMDEAGRTGDDYQMIQGTSMSSPHAAGAGALVRALHREWTPDQIKSALMSTAFRAPDGGKESVSITKEDHITPSDPFDRGAGRIDVGSAVRAGFTVAESVAGYQAANPALGGEAHTLNLASLANDSCAATCTWTRTLVSTSDRSITYSVSATAAPGVELSVSPSTFTLDPIQGPTIAPGLPDPSLPGSQTVTITSTIGSGASSGWQFGEIRFDPDAAGLPTQHFPVAVKQGGVVPAPDCEIPETIVATSGPALNVPDYNDIVEMGIAGVFPTLGGEATPNVAFRMTVEELGVNGALPPNQHWRFAFHPPGAPAGTNYYVQMTTNTSGQANFVYGTLAGGSFSNLGAPEAGSYDLATSTIEWTIASSKILNVQPGDTLSAIAGASGAAQPGALTTSVKTVNGSDYTLTSCSVDPTPTPTPTPTPDPTPTPIPCDPVVIFEDDLEPDAGPGWTTGTAANDNPLSLTWQVLTDPGAHSASNSWMSDSTTLALKDDRLVAPPQLITPSTRLSFWHRFFFEDGFDGGVLEISTDAGASWADVTTMGTFVAGAYNGTIEADFGSPIAGREAWTGGSPTALTDAMSQTVVDIGGFVPAGEQSIPALIRWRLTADPVAVGALPGVAWWVDDVRITDETAGCPTPTPTPTPTPDPTPTPTPDPTPTPTPEPTPTPTPGPTPTPTPGPTPTPTPGPTPTPTPDPTPTPTPTPTPEPGDPIGILLLNTWKNGALTASGSSSIAGQGGDIVVNSASRAALKALGGSSSISLASPGRIRVVGAATGNNSGYSPQPETGQQPVDDPLAGYTKPDTSDMPSRSSSGSTLQPGIYEGGISISGSRNVTLMPGIYVMRNGGFSVTGSATVTGSEVVIFNTTSAYPAAGGSCAGINFGDSARLTLSAPTSGDYRGLLVYQDDACAAGMTWSGNSVGSLTGTTYVPAAAVAATGSAIFELTQLIADQLTTADSVEFSYRFDSNLVAHH